MKIIFNKIARSVYSLAGSWASRLFKTKYNKVVLASNRALGYMCNPKYIAEILEKTYPGKFDLVLLTRRYDQAVPSYIRQISPRGIRSIYELATARFWIDNCRYPKLVPKRSDQIYIQTWHAYTSAGKKVEADAGDSLSREYQANAKYDASITDLMFADNDHAAAVYRNSFWYSGPIVRCSTPRNEPLLHPDSSTVEKVREFLGVPDGAGICLYAPTFRKDYSQKSYLFDYEGCIDALSKRFGRPFVFAYRLHPNLIGEQAASFLEDYVDAGQYLDAQELLSATDVLISDYSSILDDFTLTQRPGFIFASDIEEYRLDRNLYFPPEARPYDTVTSSSDLIDAILAYDDDVHKKRCEAFLHQIGYSTHGHGPGYLAGIIDMLTDRDTTVMQVVSSL